MALVQNTNSELLSRWDTEEDMVKRDAILEEMTNRGLFPEAEVRVFPQEQEDKLEEEGGLYPDVNDPEFLNKLLNKTEFAENKQPSLLELINDEVNPCDPNQEFELSPVQRFVGQYMSPKTPYNSALLYHGVGVGKTCSAITVAEAYLEKFPNDKVIIVAPPNIQPGFDRTIFNGDQLILGKRDGEPNTAKGCTGNTYLKLAGMEYSRDKNQILSRITRLKAKRYQLFGYIQFYNYIRDKVDKKIFASLTAEQAEEKKYEILSNLFSGRLIIIDEAHNLRDVSGETEEENLDAPGGEAEMTETKAGKQLTPYIRDILTSATGLKLLLLTATPMYNSYREIIFLMNLLLLNDKRATLREDDIFNKDGTFKPNGEKILGRVASAYLSFMRGENPLSFPIRLEPIHVPRLTEWPALDPKGVQILKSERDQIKKLPFVSCQFEGTALQTYKQLSQAVIASSKGLGLQVIDSMIQAGNWLFPESSLSGTDINRRIREEGFSNIFEEVPPTSLKQFKTRTGVGAQWLREDQIANYSPKAAFLIKRLRTTKGVSFVYSRFVKSGALTLAMALEANGYTVLERNEKPFLKDGNQYPDKGRQCAECPLKEKEHGGASHPFTPAYYVLLTGRDEYTPHNKEAVEKARSDANKDGKVIKVVIGSQVASEGIDLRFIRECFVFDSWYHLNKLEQVIGRCIRMCSHALLNKDYRNCTINLLVTAFDAAYNRETIDMYQYRMGFQKAKQVGQVTRVLKKYALDCNLNHDSVLIQGLPPVKQIDSQGNERMAERNDMPFTSMCDWMDDCDYDCGIEVEVNPLTSDDSTYDEYAARWRESQIKQRLRELFEKQTHYSKDRILALFEDIPRVALTAILADIVGNRSFRIRIGNQDGYIIYKNGLYLFQPEIIKDTSIPLALRAAMFPVKRDHYEPMPIQVERKALTIAPTMPTVANLGVTVGKPKTTTTVATEQPTQLIQGFEVWPDYKNFWKLCVEWVVAIQNGTAPDGIPNPLKDSLRIRYSGNKRAIQRATDALEMIPWLYSVIRTSEDKRKAFGQIVAELIWDEFLNILEQYEIYKELTSGGAELTDFMKEVCKENLVASGSSKAYRTLNPINGNLTYICDGKPCAPSLIVLFEAKDKDPLAILKADESTTAKHYGSLNIKSGVFVFKTNEPVAVGKSPNRGSECANVSNISSHYELLEKIGKLVAGPLGTNLDLTSDVMITGPRAFQNSVRACMLTDIVLRLLNKLTINGKRWFYRPIATYKTGHTGKTTGSQKLTSQKVK